jgi:hypothetical protein
MGRSPVQGDLPQHLKAFIVSGGNSHVEQAIRHKRETQINAFFSVGHLGRTIV